MARTNLSKTIKKVREIRTQAEKARIELNAIKRIPPYNYNRKTRGAGPLG